MTIESSEPIRVRINLNIPEVAELFEKVDSKYEKILELEAQQVHTANSREPDDLLNDEISELEKQIGNLYKKAMDITRKAEWRVFKILCHQKSTNALRLLAADFQSRERSIKSAA